MHHLTEPALRLSSRHWKMKAGQSGGTEKSMQVQRTTVRYKMRYPKKTLVLHKFLQQLTVGRFSLFKSLNLFRVDLQLR